MKLRTFRIYCFDEDENEMATAHHLISALDAPNLEILSLIIFYDPSESESDDFQRIDELLEKFAHLKEVRVEYFDDSGEPFDVRKKYAEQNFPLTTKRGLLQVKECHIEYLPHHSPQR